jgi:hypothetical protein
MAKLFGLLLIAAAVYVGLTLHEQGRKRAFGGIFAASSAPAPIPVPLSTEPDDPGAADRAADARIAREASPGAVRAGAITSRVRERVTDAMEQGASRNGR